MIPDILVTNEFRPNKINILFPVTCWKKEGWTVGKQFYFKGKFL